MPKPSACGSRASLLCKQSSHKLKPRLSQCFPEFQGKPLGFTSIICEVYGRGREILRGVQDERGEREEQYSERSGKSFSSAGLCSWGLQLSGKMNTKPNLAYAASTQHRSQGPVLSLTSNFNTEEPERSDIENLKLFAMSLSQNGRKDAAESIMRCECNKWKGTSSSNQLKVALIELLLYQGKYQEAKETIQDLMKDMADLPPEKVYFLKAIAESATDKAKAAQSWEEYHRKTSEETLPYSAPMVEKGKDQQQSMHARVRDINDAINIQV
ncbi:uncharacterized protein LOC129306830 isoform X2 [Prosopis cineraria]|uniref:uncharacterized protein LOC129306830 isoform X2 n=1 Tax=Prosopis cineraria TaxID=364024 RepID=UPI00240EC481|nr:uncharacterized protein LOC129306830 isoform X2 [Prosopis cineraria]